MEGHQLSQHPCLRPLWAGMRREWQQKTVALVMLLLGCTALAYSCWEEPLIVLVFAFICLAGALLALMWHWRGPSEMQLLQRLLHDQPRRVVWVYSLRTEYHPFGLQFLQQNLIYFKLDDGSNVSVRLPSRRLRLVMRILQRALPHTVFGYRREWEELYARRPKSFPELIMDA